jgi:ariadne-1
MSCDRYEELLNRTYVDDKQNLRWCPAPECEYAVDCPIRQNELHKVVPTVVCNCSHRFCFGCGLHDHQPCPCSLVKKWLKKCEDDSETANWISAHTKECPKCVSTIEKNGGCNHMTWYVHLGGGWGANEGKFPGKFCARRIKREQSY